MRSLKIIIPVILVFILIVAGIYAIYQAQVSPQDKISITPLPTPKNTFSSTTPTASPKTNGTTSVQNQPATGPEDELEIKNAGIAVESITPNQKISSPLKLTGIANVTSQTVIVNILDISGNILGQGKAAACVGLTGCNFEASVVFVKPQITTGYIEVYSPSVLDSTKTYLQRIPVSFQDSI